MRVLIADKFSSQGRQTLEILAHKVVYRPELTSAELPAALAELSADILVVRSTRVTSECLGACDSLSVVIRAGAGVNTIDLTTASRRGIFVANCPGKNAIAVAELTMGLVLSLDRRIVDATAELRAGTWNKKRFGKSRGIFGQRLGLIGFGMIAREVATRAQAFGIEIQAYSRRGIAADVAEKYDVSVAPDIDTILRQNDIVSLHVPYNDNTHHMIGREQLALMQPGALIINTSRGGIIDDAALYDAVREGRVRAGLDVCEGEPSSSHGDYDNQLLQLQGVYATPHIGASTSQAEAAIGEEVVRIVRAYILDGVVPNTVNIVQDRVAHYNLVVRHLDRVGVLAGVLEALREQRVNVQDMQNIVFARGEAACATLSLEHEPSAELLTHLRGQESILAVGLRRAASQGS
ncbi:MAG: NAD(P)-dependent oxidoreductase [Nannocystaceae bacterium]